MRALGKKEQQLSPTKNSPDWKPPKLPQKRGTQSKHSGSKSKSHSPAVSRLPWLTIPKAVMETEVLG